MNDLARMFRRPVELALEPPFPLGRLLVTPAALELRREDEVRTVEPRVMQVLVVLHRARGQAVSREELSDLCWKGRIVGDDSLNRSISQLRKALSDEPGVAVDTIPRIGYRLRLGLNAASAAAPPRVETPAPPPKWRWRLAASLVVLVAVAAGAAAWFMRPTSLTAGALRPLTREAGVETHPALSPEGGRLAYASGPGNTPRDLYLRGVALGEGAAERLTETPDADEYAPAWSPGGDRLVFIRLQADGSCAVVLVTPPNGAERALGQCRNAPAGLAWLSEDEVAYDDRQADEAPRRIYALSVVSGMVRPLTAPPSGATGDAAPAVSPDRRRMAFRRTFALGSDDLVLIDLQTGRERRLTQDGWKATGFAWSGKDTLFFTSNRGGDFGLWALDVRAGGEPVRVSPGVMPLGRLSSDAGGRRLAVEAARLRAPLHEVTAGGARPAAPPDGVDWDPDIGPDGRLVFGSDRSGANEIWTARPDGALTRLTSMGASYVHSPRWSADGGRIAFIGVVRGRTDLYLMRADGSGLRRLTEDGRAKGRVAWLPGADGLVYSTRDAEGWRLMRLSPASGAVEAVPGGAGVAVVERQGGRLLARRADRAALLELDPATGTPRAAPTAIETDGLESWRPGAEGVFQIRREGGSSWGLWLTEWTGPSRRVRGLGSAPRSNFAVRDQGAIIAPQTTEDESDLMLLEIDRR